MLFLKETINDITIEMLFIFLKADINYTENNYIKVH